MTTPSSPNWQQDWQQDWQTVNQQYLTLALMKLCTDLEQFITRSQPTAAIELEPELENYQKNYQENYQENPEPEIDWDNSIDPPALETLCVGFGLTPFERNVLLLCAGVELSASLAHLCATAQGNPQFTYPTFSLALAALPDANWNTLAPVAPLRHWRLIEVDNRESLTQSRLRIDERVLHYLTGVSYLDDRLQGLVNPVPQPERLPPTHQRLVQQLINHWAEKPDAKLETRSCTKLETRSVIQLCDQGAGIEAIVQLAAFACCQIGMQLYRLDATDIPATAAEREALARLWEREAILSRSALLITCRAGCPFEQMRPVIAWIETVQSLVLIAGREPLHLNNRPTLHLNVVAIAPTEQLDLWQTELRSVAPQLNGNLQGHLQGLVSQFHLSAQSIHAICTEWQMTQTPTEPEPSTVIAALWDICRKQSRSQLENLAQAIQPQATWDDLVLPAPQRQMLREMAAQVRQRLKVYDTWEFAVRGVNGLGITALFAGASGTGKTLAAEVLAHELKLDLYRIDLSQVVSKYIGETEKNLRRVFDAAEAGGAILLFDEADALFGKRSEVKDSHDRYANIEVSYLLQRMEAYRGLAILTTNLKNAIDTAFLRRLRFVVQFPFPDMVQRAEIWRRMFPAKLPTEGLDFLKLARLNIAGGNIRNIALNAAFLAADAEEPVRMIHLHRAAQSEYIKLEKPVTEAELGGWT